ncbi:MAG: histidine kinase, partial [Hymenobacter sp.]|nr:histidine kinase [Hymenobacter sp.]
MRDRRFLLWGIPILAVLAMLPRGLLEATSPKVVLFSWGYSVVVTSVLWLGNRALWLALFRRLPQVERTQRRLWLLAGGSLLYTAVAATILLYGLSWVGHFQMSARNLAVEISIDLVPTLIILLIYESANLFRQWEQNVRRAEQLARAGVQSQLEALQNQLDPHFLFNSLNTLSALIEEHNLPAQQYVEHLADVYRYVLLSRERPTVPLSEELAFVETYVALQRVRFRDNLQVSYDLPPAALTRHVAPLSVQLLVENALKHNEA